MKRLLIICITVLFISVVMSGCKEKVLEKEKIPKGVDKDHYLIFMKFYKQEWKDLTLKEEKVKQKAEGYLGKNYTAIWKGDMDADDIDDYLIVVKHPEIHHGITRGMIVDAKGHVKMYMDKEKGMITTKPGRINMYDFRYMGIRKNEVKCIRLLFTDESFYFRNKEYKAALKRYRIKGNERIAPGNFFEFELIDQDNNLLGIHDFDYGKKDAPYGGYFMIDKRHIVSLKGVDMYFMMTIGQHRLYSKAQEYAKKRITMYRRNKAKGIVVKAINFKP